MKMMADGRPPRGKDIKGEKKNKLTAIESTGVKSGNGDFIWKFSCECGNTVETTIGRFNYEHVKSCGCFRIDNLPNRKNYHGMKHSITYTSWRKMLERCCTPTCKDYKDYGGAGIQVCERWKNSFKDFYEDMGDRPSPEYTIDRVDTTGSYSPENCVWSPKHVQSRNRRSSKGSSKHKGVSYDKYHGKWSASIAVAGTQQRKIGRYINELAAAQAYNLATRIIFGEDCPYTILNDTGLTDECVNLDCKFFRETVYELKSKLKALDEEFK